MSIASEIAGYISTVDTNVTTQTDVNSVSPVEVGEIGTDLASLLLPYMEEINDFGVTAGSAAPDDANGSDKDIYFMGGSDIKVYRKDVSTWTLLATIPLGITFPDGPLTIRTSLSGMTVTVSPGSWSISNQIYSKATQTQFTLGAADANFGRIDLIYANTSDSIGISQGTPSASPANPSLPANSVVVDYAIVPSVASGDDPYMLYGSVVSAVNVLSFSNNTAVELTSANLNDTYTDALLGTEVICESIGLIYKKGASGWYSLPMGSV